MSYCIAIHRELRVEKPHNKHLLFEVMEDNANDWTHFTHLHGRHILAYRLLYKSGAREIFHYKARRLYPLPFYDHYVVFRDYRKEQNGYRNVYYNVRTGQCNFLHSTVREEEEAIVNTGDFVFTLPEYWRFFPRLFCWVFKRRMRGLILEDNVLIKERLRQGGEESLGCKPVLPEQYDLFDAMFGSREMPKADVSFEDRTVYPEAEILARKWI